MIMLLYIAVAFARLSIFDLARGRNIDLTDMQF